MKTRQLSIKTPEKADFQKLRTQAGTGFNWIRSKAGTGLTRLGSKLTPKEQAEEQEMDPQAPHPKPFGREASES